MLSSYVPIFIMVAVAAVIACGMAGGSFLLGPKKPNEYKSSQYECGMTPVGTARERFPIKFYLIAMLFIVFDIETIFLYPWAVTYRNSTLAVKTFNFVEMGIFVVILFVGYFYILGKGALDWEESERAPSSPDVITSEVRAARPALRYGNEGSGPVDLGKVPAHRPLPAYGASSQEEFERLSVTAGARPENERLLR